MSTQVETEMFWSDKVPEFHGEAQNFSPKELRLIRSDLLTFIEQAQGTESSKTYVIFRPRNGGQFAIVNNYGALECFAVMVRKNYPVSKWSKSHKGSCALRGKDRLPPYNYQRNVYGRGRWA